MTDKQENTVVVAPVVAEPIDPSVFAEVQKELLQKKQMEVDELEHSISNINFSMERLNVQLQEKRRMLENRLAELNSIKGTTFDNLLNKKG